MFGNVSRRPLVHDVSSFPPFFSHLLHQYRVDPETITGPSPPTSTPHPGTPDHLLPERFVSYDSFLMIQIQRITPVLGFTGTPPLPDLDLVVFL